MLPWISWLEFFNKIFRFVQGCGVSVTRSESHCTRLLAEPVLHALAGVNFTG